MNRAVLGGLGAVVLVGGAALVASSSGLLGQAASGGAPDARTATYRIGRELVTLVGGRAERPVAPGSAAKAVTTLGDKGAQGDLDRDGRTDTIAIVTDEPGGSGTFSYVGAVMSGGAAAPTVLLGDRVVVTRVRIDGTSVIVDYLEHAAGTPMTAPATVPVTKRLVLDKGELVAR